MTIWKLISKAFRKTKDSLEVPVKEVQPVIPKPKKKGLADLKQGDEIYAYWEKCISNNGIGTFTVLSNDPETRKLLLQKRWSNYEEVKIPEYEKVIFNYDSIHFKDFHLLNPHINEIEIKKQEVKINTINKLQKQVKEAIQNEDWQRVDELNEEITKQGNRAPEL